MQEELIKIPRERTDFELIEGAKKGNRKCLELLYDRYSRRIFQKCVGMTGDRNMAKDLTHDIFIKIFTNLNSFKGKSEFSLWVHSITYNHCINFLNKKKRTVFEQPESQTFLSLTVDEIEAEHQELMNLRTEQLHFFMKKLHPEELSILLLRYQDGMSVKQISKALNLGESAVKMRLKRSRDHLARLIKNNDHEQ